MDLLTNLEKNMFCCIMKDIYQLLYLNILKEKSEGYSTEIPSATPANTGESFPAIPKNNCAEPD